MNDLEKYFYGNSGKLIHKWKHYFEPYERHFAKFRGKEVNILEFGVSEGGSLQMWKNYFGPKANILGVDINPDCQGLEEDQVKIMIGDQEDRKFLQEIARAMPRIDVLIDDGGHTMKQQINTFEELFPHVDKNGVYLCEDLHTSYWEKWGGGVKRAGTFIEYSKDFIDYIHGWHSKDQQALSVSPFTRTVHSLHYYDSILVIEKRPMKEPERLKTGTPSLPSRKPAKPRTLLHRMKRAIKRITKQGQ